MKHSAAISRRQVIQTGALAAMAFAAGCTGSDKQDPNATGSTAAASQPPEDPDVTLLTSAIADEELLRNYCEDALTRHRQLTHVVTPVLQRQRDHVRRLRATLTDGQPRRNSAVSAVPAESRQALNKLRQLVSSAEEARLSDCLAAESGLLARVFASASAAHALTVESVRKT